jgi:DNA-binding transcriptional regulator/RsmH inhibitor MraZ
VKPAQSINLATLYSGQSRHTIDDSNRIMLPSEWRVKGSPDRFIVVLVAEENHLLVCPPPVWETCIAELQASIADKTLIPELERGLNRRVRQVGLDRFGRLPLPREFATRLGLLEHGDLLGRFSKFEVWPDGQLEKPSPLRATVEALIAEKVKTL